MCEVSNASIFANELILKKRIAAPYFLCTYCNTPEKLYYSTALMNKKVGFFQKERIMDSLSLNKYLVNIQAFLNCVLINMQI